MSERGPHPPAGFFSRLARALLVRQNVRRSVMFYLLAAALGFVLVGGILFPGWLRQRPMVFLWWWASCSALTLLAVFLAVADLLLLRVTERAARRALRASIDPEKPSDEAKP